MKLKELIELLDVTPEQIDGDIEVVVKTETGSVPITAIKYENNLVEIIPDETVEQPKTIRTEMAWERLIIAIEDECDEENIPECCGSCSINSYCTRVNDFIF